MANSTFPIPAASATLQQTIAVNAGSTTTVTIPAGRGYVFANLGNIVSGWVPAATIARWPTSPTTMTYYSYLCAPGNVIVYLYY